MSTSKASLPVTPTESGDCDSAPLAHHELFAEYDRRVPSSARLKLALTGMYVVLAMGMSVMTFVLVSRSFAELTPQIHDDLSWKARIGAKNLAQAAELVLAVADGAERIPQFDEYRADSNVVMIAAVNKQGKLVALHGTLVQPLDTLFAGKPNVVLETEDYLLSWAPSDIEGQSVGRVALAMSTKPLRAGEQVRREVLLLAAGGGLVALVLSVLFMTLYLGPLISITERALAGLRELATSLDERVRRRTTQLVLSKQKIEHSLAELHNAQRKLMDASRMAGMAEVATSVLHNVGNVLNSVNVSSNIVMDSLRRSKVGGVAKVVELMRAHESDIGAFIASDEKGRRLPTYLAALATDLSEERGRMLDEMESVAKNIDHIKVIVTMQQNHAKTAGGMNELIAVTDIVEDAIKFHVISYEKHGIQLEREFDELPQITTDRHKVLQILMNLLSNARHAVRGRSSPRIVLRVRQMTDALLAIQVSDNGVGIPSENRKQIFVHGFTTKPEGHGFGLHSSALAARDLGGTLSFHSEGENEGATFTLELPFRAAPRISHPSPAVAAAS